MLFQATLLVDLIAMATTLWMAFYLFARGFPNSMTLRMVIVSLLLSFFFYGAYGNIFVQVPGTAAVRAVLLVIVLGGWYGITYRVMSEYNQKRFRWSEWGIYGLGIISIFLLLQPGAFIGEIGNALYVAHMSNRPPYVIYSLYQFLVSFGILWNLLVGDRVGLTSRGKYYFAASIFPVLSVIYGVISLGSKTPSPRIIQDTLVFLGIFILNLAVARHQVWMERRATLQDFPLTTFSVLGLSALYGFVAWSRGMPLQFSGSVVGLAIITMGLYDLVREFLERSRMRNESLFRKQLNRRDVEGSSGDLTKIQIQNGLDLLCQTIDAPGGFVAARHDEEFIVLASQLSFPVGSGLSVASMTCEDLCHPTEKELSLVAWLAPVFEGRRQVAVVGVNKSVSRIEYSSGSLELLSEVADQIGTIISLSNIGFRYGEQIHEYMKKSQASLTEMNSATDTMLSSFSVLPDTDLIRVVEDALRHLPDAITLGQSVLAEKLSINNDSHIERGKQLQKLLISTIESLKPAEKRPAEPLPRLWYSYAVLHDAYVEGVTNREIMARLYISEGTFNRTRRNAIRGLARALLESSKNILH
jgi:hypothetical protein